MDGLFILFAKKTENFTIVWIMFIKISEKFRYYTARKGNFHCKFMVAFMAFITFTRRRVGGRNKPWEQKKKKNYNQGGAYVAPDNSQAWTSFEKSPLYPGQVVF